MHPIVFSQFHQLKRSMGWQLLIILFLSAVLQSIIGLPAVLLLLSPAGATAMGVALFSEEYGKGQLRFFYSMPISPVSIWCIKVLSGIVGMSLFVAVVLLPALFIHRPRVELPGIEDELDLFTSILVPILAGEAILGYAAGLFTIGFCQIQITAGLLAALISIIPFTTYLLLAAGAEFALPGSSALVFALAIASLPLWVGAYVLFRLRNPFVDQPWRWRGVAALFVGFQVLVTIGVGYSLTLHPVDLTDPYRDGVYYYTVFGNDSKVFVLGRRSRWDVEAYVLDSNGRLAQHLFHIDQALFLRPERLREATDSPIILCDQKEVSFKRSSAGHTRFLLNLETGTQTPVSTLQGNDRNTHYDYRRPSRDGRSLMGFKEVHQDDRSSTFAFQQDLINSNIREVPIFEGRGYVKCLFLDDHQVLLSELDSDKPPGRKLTLIDMESETRTLRQLPADVRESELAPDGRTCAAVRWTIQGDTIRQELAVLDVSTGVWKTVFTPEELPQLAVKDVLANRQRLPSVSYAGRHGPDWMICTVDRGGAAATRWLIDSQTGARFKLPKKNKEEVSGFAKDGSIFFTLSRTENEKEPGSHSGDRFLSFYRIKNSGVELVNSLAWDAALGEPVWLGNDRLLFLKRENRSNEQRPHRKRLGWEFIFDRGELWTVDIQTGQHLPFFAGNDAVTKD